MVHNKKYKTRIAKKINFLHQEVYRDGDLLMFHRERNI